MSGRIRWSIRGLPLLLMSVLLILVSCTANQAIPAEVSKYSQDWPLANYNYSNTRATTDSNIRSTNIKNIGTLWTLPILGVSAFGAAATNPIIAGNTAYFQDLKNNVFAVDLAKGTILWQKLFDTVNIGPNGIAVGYGKVFASADPYNFVALDANNGSELWRTKVSDVNSVGTDIQPVVYDGKVYLATVPGTGYTDFYAGGGIGMIYALDQATGKIVWSFSTVDSADIWGNKAVNSGGGCWFPPAIDTKTNTMYWGVSNPAPFPGTTDFPNGTSRPGSNFYTDSLLSLDAKTGKLNWYTQVLSHDLFDHDLQLSPILATASINGKKQDIILCAGKMGIVYAFNRQTGAILWQTPVGTHQNDNLNTLPADQTTTVYPGIYGGVETPMALYKDILFVPVVNLSTDFVATAVKGVQPFTDGTGELLAININTGKIVWDKKFNSLNLGGATVINDTVLTSTFDGTLYGYKWDTGNEVWSFKAAGGINAEPAVNKDMILVPVGMGDTPVLMALKLK